MVADRPPFPIYVLSGRVDTAGYQLRFLSDPPAGTGWWEIPCASRRAYGCGEKIQEALQGLRLYARLGDGQLLASSLAIRMTRDALASLGLELDPQSTDYDDSHSMRGFPDAVVAMADEQGLTVILLTLRRYPGCYLLVHDAFDSSLSMIQTLPDAYRGVCTMKPIVERTDHGGDYKLLFLTHESGASPHEEDVFTVGSPACDGHLSKFKRMHFPAGGIPEPFLADVAFSFQGKESNDFWCVWGDLDQGLVYCNPQTSGDFGFIKLPIEPEVDVDAEWVHGPHELIKRTRTMGLVGDSIWFVSICSPSHYTNDVVSIWEIELPRGKGKLKEGQWKKVEEVSAKELWELPSFKESGLPAAPFRYPILMADGDLSFVLVDQTKFQQHPCSLVDHFCSFGMRFIKKLKWHGLVHGYHTLDSVIMYPSSRFLQMKRCSHKRSFQAEDSGSDSE